MLGHVLTAATVALLGASTPSARTEVTASLAPVVSASAPQGSPFAFNATVSSTTSAQLTFSLVPPAGAPVAFDRQPVEEGAHVLTGSVVSSEYFARRGRYRLVASVGDVRVGSPLAFDVTRPLVQPAVFRDVTAASGIRTTTSLGVCGDWSSGAAWGDVNGDGRPDLVVTRLERPLQLYVSVGGGRFRDEAAARGSTTATRRRSASPSPTTTTMATPTSSSRTAAPTGSSGTTTAGSRT